MLSGFRLRLAGLLTSATLLVIALIASLGLGTAELELDAVVGAFVRFDGSTEHLIITELRLPRTLIGLVTGASLALAGTLMQGVTRNALAEPGILGINAGAAFAVVLAISGLGIASPAGYVWFALGGAVLAAGFVYALGAAGRGGTTPVRLAMAGAVLAAMLVSVTSAILVLDAQTLDRYRFWIVGSIAGRDLGVLAAVLPFALAGIVLGIVLGRPLNALGLGEEVARSLGQRVGPTRTVTWGAVVLLSGAAVAAAGPVAFVGLAVPHAARIVVGADYRWITAYAVLLGPILLLGADILGRIVARPAEVQVGVMTALIGAPVFIWLVRRNRLAEV